MQSQIKWFLILILILFSFSKNAFPQQQDMIVEVILDMEQLPQDARDKLANFKSKVEEYLNKNKYHDEKIPPIRVQIQFSFTGYNSASSSFDAKIFIGSQREVYNPFRNGPVKYSTAFRYLDERCEFIFTDNIPFVKNDQKFDPLLSLLDYFAYLIVGYDEDSYNPKGGNRYFQKALDICNKAGFNIKGWNETGGGSKPSRVLLIQELLNPRFDHFRRGYFEYMYTGLDSMTLNRPRSYVNILDALEVISSIKKKEVKAFNVDIFFDSKAVEIADTFLEYGNKAVYDKLISFDPAHQAVYLDAKGRAR